MLGWDFDTNSVPTSVRKISMNIVNYKHCMQHIPHAKRFTSYDMICVQKLNSSQIITWVNKSNHSIIRFK